MGVESLNVFSFLVPGNGGPRREVNDNIYNSRRGLIQRKLIVAHEPWKLGTRLAIGSSSSWAM